ncbi:peptidase S8/S53 domain-containing protein [Aspergillus filifer]
MSATMRFLIVLFTTLATVALARPSSDHRLHERRDALPASWIEHTRLAGHEILPVRIGLAQPNLAKGHDLLMDISNPTSPRYGKHLLANDVHDLFAPSRENVDYVRQWLESEGISGHRISQSVNKQWLQFDATASEMERLLRTEYYLYSHLETGKSHIATREYHVPRHLHSIIDFISPAVKMLEVGALGLRKRSLGKRQQTPSCSATDLNICETNIILSEVLEDPMSFCDKVLTPPCIRAMYDVPQGTTATPGNELGIFQSMGDMYSQKDLDLAFSSVAQQIPNGTHPVLHGINGGVAPTAQDIAGPESAIDFQLSYPLIWPQQSTLFQTDDPVYQQMMDNGTLGQYPGGFNNFLDAIDGSYCDPEEEELDPPYPNPLPGGWKGEKQCGVYKPTNVISISYGGAESELPVRYLRRQCTEWMKLGLQGVSVVVASGDHGVATNACLGQNQTIFSPGYIGSCPYVTAVGSTTLPRGSDPYNPEETAVEHWSGGGFSNVFERPAYQNSSVEDYFSSVNITYPYYETVDNSSIGANGGIYNRIGRGYPDVSTVGINLLVYLRGIAYSTGGTSASAPIFASLLTRINEERLARNMSTVGFVNPVLYQHPEAFRDVTAGYNDGCGTNGFPATEGWDPVTGLGTPVYSKLLEVFLNL